MRRVGSSFGSAAGQTRPQIGSEPEIPAYCGSTAVEMRAAAIDLGKVRVGLAVADELGLMAHPRPHLDGTRRRALIEALARFADDEGIGVFIVGLPRTLRGVEGPPARRARVFAAELATRTGRKVELVEEWLSTREAQSRLHEQGLTTRDSRSRIDSASAAVLLQAWLDRRDPDA